VILLPVARPRFDMMFETHAGALVVQRQPFRPASRSPHAGRQTVSFPSGTVRLSFDEPNILDEPALIPIIRQACGNRRHVCVELNLSIRSTRIGLLEFDRLPSDKREREALIRWRFQDEFGVSPSEARLSFREFPLPAEAGGQDAHAPRKVRVLAAAIRTPILEQYQRLCVLAECFPVSVGLHELALFDRCRPYFEGSNEFLFATCLNGAFFFVAVRNGLPTFLRTKVLAETGPAAEQELTATIDYYLSETNSTNAAPLPLFVVFDAPAVSAAGDRCACPSAKSVGGKEQWNHPRVTRVCIAYETIVSGTRTGSESPLGLFANFSPARGAIRPLQLSFAAPVWSFIRGLQAVMIAATITSCTLAGWFWQEWRLIEDQQAKYREAVARQEAANQRFAEQMRQAGLTLTDAQISAIREDLVLADRLADKRAFSWTALLDDLEQGVPGHVSISSVRLDVHDSTVTLQGLARSLQDLSALVNQLEAQESFRGVRLVEHHVEHTERPPQRTERGQTGAASEKKPVVSFTVTTFYRPRV
jgi:Tfp pilus assembly protein PilN